VHGLFDPRIVPELDGFGEWRCDDPLGSLLSASSWNRTVASVDGLFKWAVVNGRARQNPLEQRQNRSNRNRAVWREESTIATEQPPRQAGLAAACDISVLA
jgi:hypothetical protein